MTDTTGWIQSTISVQELEAWFFGLGLLLFFTGLAYRFERIEKLDGRIFHCINTRFQAFSGFFRYIWPIGTSPVALLFVAMTYSASLRVGTLTTIGYFLISIIERGIKMKHNRMRPFLLLPGIAMNQPNHPKDPSYPSGDAMRVWFLALTIPMVFDLTYLAYVIACLIAGTLSLGRTVLGVHFPFDVVGGVGLGFIGAAFVSFSLNSSIMHSL